MATEKATKGTKEAAVKTKIASSLASLRVEISSLHEDPNNARKHDERNIAAIASSLSKFGQQKPVVVLPDGTIVAGNGTFRAAQRMKWTHLAAVAFEGTPEEALGFAIADNRTAELAVWEETILAQSLQTLSELSDGMVADFGFTDEEFMKLVGSLEPKLEEPAASPPESPASTSNSTQDGPPSNVRMVQLFLSDETQPLFMEWTRYLASRFGKTNVTDTVFDAVKHAYDAERTKAEAS